jgi:2-polyprenyl-3-methyl-5-hydroxy-6-metoxy-1,4-benzoquinol methylase
MHYDPIKKVFGDIVRKNSLVRIIFYKFLGMMFLREWYVKRELKKQLGRSTRPISIYDAGSGFGQYSYYMAKRFSSATIYGIDLKEEQVEDCNRFFQSQKLYQCSFAVEDLTSITHSEKFDLILSVDVMEHIPDDIGVFQNFFRALKSGGLLIINTPSNLGGSDAHSEEDESFIGEHARNGYGADEIREKLLSAGFFIVSLRYTYGPWGNRYWRLGIKYPMKLLNISKGFFILLPFYYCLTLPFILSMMWFDFISDNTTGTGLNVVAKKI